MIFMDRQLFLASKKIMLTVFLLLAISYVQAQETKEPLTLTLDKALEIALSDNPTIYDKGCRRGNSPEKGG